MATDAHTVEVGGKRLRISNLDKVLYPDDGITKAEVIQYYVRMAPVILRHIRGRPLSVIRFPEGVGGESFFQKNRPDHAPEWVEHVLLGDEKKLDYMMANNEATIAWLANMAALEIHQWHARAPEFYQPDNIAFDVDPPESWPFEDVIDLSLRLREHLESYGYTPFAKTSGKKGIHLHVPILARWHLDEVFDAAKAVASAFVARNRKTATMHLSKSKRGNKALIDVLRNRPSQTIISPYSLRAAPRAPVSMPLPWDEIAALTDPTEFNVQTVFEKVAVEGDAWEAMPAYAIPLHTARTEGEAAAGDGAPVSNGNGRASEAGGERAGSQKDAAVKGRARGEVARSAESAAGDGAVGDDARLQTYAAKRDFARTSEPPPVVMAGDGRAFVIHRHHARRLHYDLRLEWEGALRSWAVPKGLPPRPGVKRLAVATEDHPMKYLTFEGVIPKGEYGAGPMWVFATGRYEVVREKKDGLYFRLHADGVAGEYRIYRTDEKNFLLERLDQPQMDWLRAPIDPMKAVLNKRPPAPADDYHYEVKWDGVRALVAIEEGEVRLVTRNQHDVTAQFPELTDPSDLRAATALFDAELVCFDDDGKPDFSGVMRRLLRTSRRGSAGRSCTTGVTCFLFDCLYLDGRVITNEPIERRRAWLEDALRHPGAYQLSKNFPNGGELWEAVQTMGLEGMMAKKKASPYRVGRRSEDWLKIKVRRKAHCRIVGYTLGEGGRRKTLGALQVAEEEDGRFVYRGGVGSGFSDAELERVKGLLDDLPVLDEPPEGVPDDSSSVWVEPELICDVEYASLTSGGRFRDPVYHGLRPDLMEKVL